jgi:hypothetical protein
MADNLWGDLAGINAGPRAPISILREQSGILATATKGLVHSVVAATSEFSGIAYSFSLVAPALNHTIELFAVNYTENLYPLRIWPKWGRSTSSIECKDEESFKTQLGTILGSPEIKTTIAGLISQSKALKSVRHV